LRQTARVSFNAAGKNELQKQKVNPSFHAIEMDSPKAGKNYVNCIMPGFLKKPPGVVFK
jgi:hypothetical protein